MFVQHSDAQYEPMQPGNPGFDVHPDFAPLPGQPIAHNRARDTFYQTNLEDMLHAIGTVTLITGGFQTELCIDTTCRSAQSHGYDVVLVSDGHSTGDRHGFTARQIIDHTNAVLPEVARQEKTTPSSDLFRRKFSEELGGIDLEV